MDGSLIYLSCAVVFGLSVVAMGLVSIATPLHRIAKALEERNKLQSRQGV